MERGRFTLGANLENLTYTGTGNFAGTGNAVANTITGGAGNDVLDGGAGNDILIGGAGNDTYRLDVSTDRVTEAANAGTDTVIYSGSTNYTLGANVENLVYTGDAAIVLTGNGLANEITGGAGNDDILGGGGNDTLLGGAGSDELNGGAGNDVLNGGTGNDVMTGGTGTDIFVFGSGFGTDFIQDFDTNPTGGQDLIDLTAFGIAADQFNSRVTIQGFGTTITQGATPVRPSTT